MSLFLLVIGFLFLLWAAWGVFHEWMNRRDDAEMKRIRREIAEATDAEERKIADELRRRPA